jgi:hypothetical protein
MRKIRLCLIGNSHLAALKLAWDRIGNQFDDIELRFFGSYSDSLKELRVKERHLVAQSKRVRMNMVMTSGGLSKIAIDDYDIFVLHALGFSFNRLIKWFLLRSSEANEISIANPYRAETRQPSFEDIKTLLDQTACCRLAKKLAPFNKPVMISPEPFFSEQVTQTPIEKWAPWHHLLDEQGHPKPDLDRLLSLWNQARLAYAFLAQPADTIVSGSFTKVEYCARSIRLSRDMATEHPPDDYSHMNAAYGAAVIKGLVAWCRTVATDGGLSPENEGAAAQRTAAMADRRHPYTDLPDRSFWRRAVSSKPVMEITDWYRKKFEITDLRIATAGSCFAQHIGRRLRQHGFNYVDMEPAPTSLASDSHHANGYGIFSARYGNVYTSRQLRQLLERAMGDFVPKEIYWEADGGYVDPFRPTIQERPFASIDELIASREQHLAAVRTLFEKAQVFIFTLGLTETWMSIDDGAVFPVAPGVSGGRFRTDKYRFRNLGFADVLEDMRAFIGRARQINSSMKFILTVSPVPLMATASAHQVAVATTYSKSVLRAVAGQLADNRQNVDYFPSFEIISSHFMEGRFYEKDLRTVTGVGVDHVMKVFFSEHAPSVAVQSESQATESYEEDDVICDEELLAAFGGRL